jgi:flavin reductase (DIM6/NTAB) family NADH-FMN oxidoreductase RutF
VTIHGENPFVDPESERDPTRRLRGRLGGAVSLWTTGAAGERAGLTVSSLMVAAGDPAHVLALVDPESEFAETFSRTGVAVVQLLEWTHRQLAETFASRFPSPGGPFRTSEWVDTEWGPRLPDVTTWAGVRLGAEYAQVGWYALVDAVVEHVEVGEETAPLTHRRGEYGRKSG